MSFFNINVYLHCKHSFILHALFTIKILESSISITSLWCMHYYPLPVQDISGLFRWGGKSALYGILHLSGEGKPQWAYKYEILFICSTTIHSYMIHSIGLCAWGIFPLLYLDPVRVKAPIKWLESHGFESLPAKSVIVWTLGKSEICHSIASSYQKSKQVNNGTGERIDGTRDWSVLYMILRGWSKYHVKGRECGYKTGPMGQFGVT